MIRLAIVEDEKIYAEKLMVYFDRYKKQTEMKIEITWFRDGCEILDNYSGEFEVILMDIQMKFMDGMSTAKKIREVDQDVIIMFLTNMTNYAIHGYEVNALDYIVKPIEYFAFCQKIERAFKRIRNKKKHYISIPVENGIRKIDIEEILYVESHGHNLCYKTKKSEVESRGVLQQLEELLVPYGFFRSSKSILVNMQYVEGMKDNYCEVRGEFLPVSRKKKKVFVETLLKYMSEVMM